MHLLFAVSFGFILFTLLLFLISLGFSLSHTRRFWLCVYVSMYACVRVRKCVCPSIKDIYISSRALHRSKETKMKPIHSSPTALYIYIYIYRMIYPVTLFSSFP